MEILELNIDDVIPYENNPRKNDASVEKVAASIKSFGFKVPCIIDENNVLIAGHTRLLAAKYLGYDKIPCIVAKDLTEEQAKAFRLADNKVGEASAWDWDKLAEELAGLEIYDIDMSLYGFDASEMPSEDIDHLFEPHESTHDGKKKAITCPHCGKEIEI